MADYGLLGALGTGLNAGLDSYRLERDYAQKQKQQELEMALKNRMAKKDEVESATKAIDSLGYLPKGLVSAEVEEQFNSAGSAGPSTPGQFFSVLPDQSGNYNQPQGMLGKRGRDAERQAREDTLKGIDKGYAAEYDPSGKVRLVKTGLSEKGQLDLDKSKQDFTNSKLEEKAKIKALNESKEAPLVAAGFGKRMIQAENDFNSLVDSGYNRAARMEEVKGYLPDMAKSQELKRQEQAELNFVNALLRKESGAAVAPSEFDKYAKQYFPRAGDGPEVLAQKKANRAQAIENLKAAAGEAWDKVKSIKTETKAPPITTPDGKQWVKNPDGTLTEKKGK